MKRKKVSGSPRGGQRGGMSMEMEMAQWEQRQQATGTRILTLCSEGCRQVPMGIGTLRLWTDGEQLVAPRARATLA